MLPRPLNWVFVSLAGLGCFGPSANGLLCSTNQQCPTGFQCYATGGERRCYDHSPDGGADPDATGDDGASERADSDPGSGSGSDGAPCPHMLCEDFESAEVLLVDWGVTHFYSNVEVTTDPTRVHGGSRALHIHLTDYQNAPNFDPNNLMPSQGELSHPLPPRDDVFMRVFVYLPPLPGTPGIRIAALQEDQPPDYPSAGLWINGTHLEVTFPDFSGFESPTPVTVGGWTCVEWEIQVGNPGQVSAWVDGAPAQGLSQIAGDTSLIGAASGELAVLGAAVFGNHERFDQYDLWFDDLAIDSARIGCAVTP